LKIVFKVPVASPAFSPLTALCKMKNKDLYLLRHGATPLHGLYVGSTDVSLAQEGREQVVRTGHLLVGEHIEHIFCSPMKRCLETLNLLNLDATFEIDENLREIDFGRWEGCSFEEIAESDDSLVEEWRISGDSFCFPEGECVKAFTRRVDEFAQKILAAANNRILVLSHGGTIRHLLCIFLELPPEKRMLFDIQAGGFSSVSLYGDTGILTRLNMKG
jgi:alpha-ribazole phosphatase